MTTMVMIMLATIMMDIQDEGRKIDHQSVVLKELKWPTCPFPRLNVALYWHGHNRWGVWCFTVKVEFVSNRSPEPLQAPMGGLVEWRQQSDIVPLLHSLSMGVD